MSPSEVAAAARKDLKHLHRKVQRDIRLAERHHKKGDRSLTLCCFGEYTSKASIQWMYVISVSKRLTLLHPMVWYFSTKGIHSVQLSENGTDIYYAPHVLQRYRERFDPNADVLQAMRNFHQRNFTMAAEYTPSGKYGPDAITGALDDGLVLGTYDSSANMAHFNTFITVDMAGAQQEELKRRLDNRRYLKMLTPGQARVMSDRHLLFLDDLMADIERMNRQGDRLRSAA